MKNCKLYETLIKCDMELDAEHMPKSYALDENIEKMYTVQCPPPNPRLQNLMYGWQKYAQYTIHDRKCKLKYNDCTVLNILHLINPEKIDDIVIFRITKKNKNDDGMSVRYVCTQNNKKQLCANLEELNNHLDKKCFYVGRKINKEDFLNV